jgi:hypothetical protein
MKRIIVLVGLAFSLAIGTTEAQTINDIPIKDIDVQYVELTNVSRLLRAKQTIDINFGRQIALLPGRKVNIIRDAEGKLVEFDEMIDALNFMAENGFELISTNVATYSSGHNKFQYILRKKND